MENLEIKPMGLLKEHMQTFQLITIVLKVRGIKICVCFCVTSPDRHVNTTPECQNTHKLGQYHVRRNLRPHCKQTNIDTCTRHADYVTCTRHADHVTWTTLFADHAVGQDTCYHHLAGAVVSGYSHALW